jgi:hypothetical protein
MCCPVRVGVCAAPVSPTSQWCTARSSRHPCLAPTVTTAAPSAVATGSSASSLRGSGRRRRKSSSDNSRVAWATATPVTRPCQSPASWRQNSWTRTRGAQQVWPGVCVRVWDVARRFVRSGLVCSGLARNGLAFSGLARNGFGGKCACPCVSYCSDTCSAAVHKATPFLCRWLFSECAVLTTTVSACSFSCICFCLRRSLARHCSPQAAPQAAPGPGRRPRARAGFGQAASAPARCQSPLAAWPMWD